jgi:hypothetical protein
MTLLVNINTFLPYIPSTVIGLLGIIFGNLFFAYRNRSDKRLDTIKTIKSSDRIRALEMYMNDMGITVNTDGLDSNQKVEVIRHLLHAKFRKYMIAAITLVTLSIIIALLIWSNSNVARTDHQQTGTTLKDSTKPTNDNSNVPVSKATTQINVYVNNKPVSGINVTADNVRDSRTTDVYGMVNLTIDNLPEIDSLHLYFKSNEYLIDTSITVPYKKTYSFNFPYKPKKPPVDTNPLLKGEAIKYLGEFDSRVNQIQRFLKEIGSTNDEKQKSYLSNGITAAFNGAKGWYQPTYPEFHEVPFVTIIQWFKIQRIENRFANPVLKEVQNASFTLIDKGIYDYNKTHSFLELLQKYRAQFKD